MSDASAFVANRRNSITENRIKNILWYIGECYTLLVKDKVQYSRTYVKTQTTIHFEDYLRFRLVEDYLTENKLLLKKRTSSLDDINFTAESQKEYIDKTDGKQKPDKIDIFINKLGLNNIWGKNDEKIYFVIECKIIGKLGDTAQYIGDIIKFTNRDYIELRLPFEGQLGFIESNSISQIDIIENINKRLQKENCIITDMLLKPCALNDNIEGTYISKHRRNTQNENKFTLYHLFLDYSKLIIN